MRDQPLSLIKVTVSPDSVDAVVHVNPDFSTVTESLARHMLSVLPALSTHLCVNGPHDRFGQMMAGTSTAHLLEHTALELMTQEAHMNNPAVRVLFEGHTSSIGAGDMRVVVTYADDLVALSALQQAAGLIAWGFEGSAPTPNMERLVNGLHALRRA